MKKLTTQQFFGLLEGLKLIGVLVVVLVSILIIRQISNKLGTGEVVSSKATELVELQKEHIKTNSQYLEVKKYTEEDGWKYQVEEYVSPKGPGYQIIVTRPDGMKKSWGEGPEASFRSYDWVLSDNPTAWK